MKISLDQAKITGPKTTRDYSTRRRREQGDLTIMDPQRKLFQAKLNLPQPQPATQDDAILPHTDVADPSKRLLIVTTAALPWKTGTAVNPLLRAAHLVDSRNAMGSVTLMLPWLERAVDQANVYGQASFVTPDEQEGWIRAWLRDEANLPQASADLHFRWYTAWQNPVENSIYSMGDITSIIPDGMYDICILEEPEHLNWYGKLE